MGGRVKFYSIVGRGRGGIGGNTEPRGPSCLEELGKGEKGVWPLRMAEQR